MDLPDFAKESVAQIQILCTFQARAAKGRRVWRETRALAARTQQKADAPGEKPVRSQRMKYRVEHGSGECRSPKVISVSVDFLHKIFITRKDELVKDLPAT